MRIFFSDITNDPLSKRCAVATTTTVRLVLNIHCLNTICFTHVLLYTIGKRFMDSVSHIVSSESFVSIVQSVLFEIYAGEDVR